MEKAFSSEEKANKYKEELIEKSNDANDKFIVEEVELE